MNTQENFQGLSKIKKKLLVTNGLKSRAINHIIIMDPKNNKQTQKQLKTKNIFFFIKT